VETNGNFEDPIEPIRMACINLKTRLERIENSLTQKDSAQKHDIHFTTEYDIFKLFISEEKHTIGQLLVKYIYQLEPSIEYVSARITHPSKEEIIIDIKHTSAKKICLSAIQNIKKDLDTFNSFFKKNA
jgi:DNA-directed RNA polymerase subunit L